MVAHDFARSTIDHEPRHRRPISMLTARRVEQDEREEKRLEALASPDFRGTVSRHTI